ncbi:hypothetical protein AOR_1_1104184 [Paecilomyces variotii No. 5]|uniref:Uncharacterized protein n=1 Tax=Byssochlamys spectabilis (strain No. 5 / NBRC 109023) TaxID=1356009 RepID=V5I3W0_BYSSN|nr:hypothetical protein AOR_1_1104184 [Paecilomyces variotii No. 5]
MTREAIVFYCFSFVTIVSTFIATVLNGVFAASLRRLSTPYSLDFASVGLNAISCVILLAWISSIFAREGSVLPTVLKSWEKGMLLAIVSYLFATIEVTGGAVAWSGVQFLRISTTRFPSRTESLLIAWTVMWAMSSFLQGLVCGMLIAYIMQHNNPDDDDGSTTGSLERRKTVYTGDNIRPDRHGVSPLTRTYSLREKFKSGSERFNSIRSSITGLIPPMTPLSERHFGRSNSKRVSKHTIPDYPPGEYVSRERAFDTWDTSGVSRENKETALRSSMLSSKPLPALPNQSRPQTANTITGSMLNSSSTTLPPSPQGPRCGPPRGLTRSRTVSLESHIHPLFRSDSPSPSPTPSPGTVLTASPAAGQTINTHTVRKIRSSSLLQTSKPLPSIDSSEDLETTNRPRPTHQNSVSSMPEFVLAAGVRHSMLDYEKRKWAPKHKAQL